jgi:hypothetical protein
VQRPQVRFEAAASLASKAFSSEEVQSVTLHAPGSHYVLLTEVATTALYGDQFSVITRYGLSAKGPNRTHLHVAYAVAFRPSLSRLMRPMVAKGVDGACACMCVSLGGGGAVSGVLRACRLALKGLCCCGKGRAAANAPAPGCTCAPVRACRRHPRVVCCAEEAAAG